MSTRAADIPSSRPSQEDSARAERASRALAVEQPTELKVRLDDGQELILPKSATPLIAHLLAEIAQGNAVSIVPAHDDLTTQEAAEQLNVSRPYLVSLLEKGLIPYHKVGTHRRIRFDDLAAFKAASEAHRREIMQELTDQAQSEDMGY